MPTNREVIVKTDSCKLLDKIITHYDNDIKKLQKRVKELEEENAKLKEENDKFKEEKFFERKPLSKWFESKKS